MAFDPFREFANQLLGTWRPTSQVLTPEDEAHILHVVREAQLAAARADNQRLKRHVREVSL